MDKQISMLKTDFMCNDMQYRLPSNYMVSYKKQLHKEKNYMIKFIIKMIYCKKINKVFRKIVANCKEITSKGYIEILVVNEL